MNSKRNPTSFQNVCTKLPNVDDVSRSQKKRYNALLSMRKHHSLDGSQFLSQFESNTDPVASAHLLKEKRQYNASPSTSFQPYFANHDLTADFPNLPSTTPHTNLSMAYGYPNQEHMDPHDVYTHMDLYANDSYTQFLPRQPSLYPIKLQTNYFKNPNVGLYDSAADADCLNMNQLLYSPVSQNVGKNCSGQQTQNSSDLYHDPFGVVPNLLYLDSGLSSEALRREYATVVEKLNRLANSIYTFWSPELKRERQLRKNEATKTVSMQHKLAQQAAEIQLVKNELEKREKEISQLLSESDLMEMEEELRRLRKQLHNDVMTTNGMNELRDFTSKTPTLHELQTAKTKMERSELTLLEKSRDLKNCEIRLKCVEEQNAELEKRADILTRNNANNEAQLKLLHDDLDVLRKKLETKNQLLESREKTIKSLEKDLEANKTKVQEHLHTIQEKEHRVSQLTYRIDQLETLLREKDSLTDRLKQRLMQSPDTRAESELQLKLENMEKDKTSLEKVIDTVRQNSEIERQNQLQAFHDETSQLRTTIENLQKELTDRQILIASQNEKISQLNTEFGINKSGLTSTAVNNIGGLTDGTMDSRSGSKKSIFGDRSLPTPNASSTEPLNKCSSKTEMELEEARNEIGRLLCIVHQLEKEKSMLNTRLNNPNITAVEAFNDSTKSRDNDKSELVSSAIVSTSLSSKFENNALRLRIEALEEALRESVGITSERERIINDQKQLIQQLSNQVNELYKNCGGKDLQKSLQSAMSLAEMTERTLAEERVKFQRQLLNLRKEIAMAVIREKEICIQLLLNPPDSLKDKVELLRRQKDQLKHQLLTATEPLGTTSVQENFDSKIGTKVDLINYNQSSLYDSTNVAYQPTMNNVFISNATAGNLPPPPLYSSMAPINVNVPVVNFANVGYSAPASLTYGKDENTEDDGIWA